MRFLKKQLPPTPVVSLIVLVVMLSSLQAQDKAEQPSVAVNSEAASKLFESALSTLEAGDYQKALEGFAQVLQIDPKHHDAMKMSAVSYMRLKDYNKEAEMYDKILAADPTDGLTMSMRGVALFRLKRFKDMEESFAKAKRITPKDGEIFENSGKCQMLLGNYQRSNDDFLAAKEKGKLSDDGAAGLMWTKRIIRQMDGDGVPAADWKPDVASYHTDMRLSRPTGYLINMPEREDATNDQQGGIKSLAGQIGTRFSFGGSSDQPFEYAPGVKVWDGAVINDPKYGVLLENGTKLLIEHIEDDKTNIGQVIGWKLVINGEKEGK